MIGQKIAHYKMIAKLGAGGMGVVYKALDTRLERHVAIKFLPPQVASQPEMRERFKIEAKAAAALNHPGIATIYAIEEISTPTAVASPGDDIEQAFIVMEYVEGRELQDVVEAAPSGLPFETIYDYAAQIAHALAAAHEKEIVHRDIKPANIMITNKGLVKVMDFGLARIGPASNLTQVGTTVGTIAFMSPEQARGDAVDQRSDIWSFGVILYNMISGQLPFKGFYDQAVIYSILNEDPEALANLRPDVPANLAQVTAKALQRDLTARYQDLGELLADLGKPLQHTAGTSSPAGVARQSDPGTSSAEKNPVHGSALTAAAPIFSAEKSGSAIVPQPKASPSLKRILLFALPFIVPVVLAVIYFLGGGGPDDPVSADPGSGAAIAQQHSGEEKNETGTPPVEPAGNPPQTSGAGQSENTPPPVPQTPPREHSALIRELAQITQTSQLMAKFNEYNREMRISVGKKKDFESTEGLYVFIVDQQQVLAVYQFIQNRYVDLAGNNQRSDLSSHYSGKTAIWVKDLQH